MAHRISGACGRNGVFGDGVIRGNVISAELDVWSFGRAAGGCARSISVLGVARDSDEMDAQRVTTLTFIKRSELS